MSYALSSSFKCCLTCAYWCGVRRLTMMEHYAETEDSGIKGMCANPQGYYHLGMVAGMPACNGYQSLPALREG